MKKLLQSWKLWTWLFILVFIMTCWLLIYAASSRDFTSFKTTTMWNTLTSQNWNNLMDSLNEYTVPQWAVMAFNSETCPDWWKEFTDAQGRFILGRQRYSYEFGKTGGAAKILLSEAQLPSHSHYIIAEDEVGNNRFRDNPTKFKNWSLAELWNSDVWDNNDQYDLAASEKPAIYAKTSSAWGWAYVNIMNPYIALLYCEKM